MTVTTVPVVGPTVLLASGRLGRQVSVNRSDRPVYVDREGLPCCAHGERATTIQSWLKHERLEPAFARPSDCDCQNIDGLMTAYNVGGDDFPDTGGASLYRLLCAVGAEATTPGSRPQRLALRMGTNELWVQPSGTVVCQHGNSRKVLAKMRKCDDAARFRGAKVIQCSCALRTPRRLGSVLVTAKDKARSARRRGERAA
jgi:hypothetical protein